MTETQRRRARRMEGSSTKEEEEEVVERTATFCLNHPCYFLGEALSALFKCLGFEIGTNRKEHKSSVVKTHSDSEEDPITPENTASNDQKSSQEVPTSAEEPADQEYSSTTPCFQLVTSITVRRGRRRSDLTPGSGPQTN